MADRYILFRSSMHHGEVVYRAGGVVTTGDGWRQKPTYASYSRVYYVRAGSGMLYSEQEQMPLEPGYVYIAPCGMKYGYYGTDSVTKLYFHINLFNFSDDCDMFADLEHFIRIPRDVAFMDQLTQWFLGEDPLDHMLIKSELYRTACEAVRLGRAAQEDSGKHSRPVMNAIGYIRRNLSGHLTVEEVARGTFCSRSRLAELFRQEMGQTVARYIHELLMSEAQMQLLYSDHSVGQISDLLGFCDQFYFSRCFTKYFGMSPTQFRRHRKA